jgi:hypothetical protein
MNAMYGKAVAVGLLITKAQCCDGPWIGLEEVPEIGWRPKLNGGVEKRDIAIERHFKLPALDFLANQVVLSF